MCVCVRMHAMYVQRPILWDATCSSMYLCTECICLYSSFVEKGIIRERGYKEYGHEDFYDKYLAGEWYVKCNPNVMDVLLSFLTK